MFYITANHLARLLIILLLIICTASHSYAYNADNAFTSQSSNRAISQHGGKAHKSDDRIAEERGGPLLQPQPSYQAHSEANIDNERGGPLLQPQPSYQAHSVANIDNERGGPLLQPQPSFQPKGAADVAGISHKPFKHAQDQSLDTLTAVT